MGLADCSDNLAQSGKLYLQRSRVSLSVVWDQQQKRGAIRMSWE